MLNKKILWDMAKTMLKCTLEKNGFLKKQLSFHLKNLKGKNNILNLERLEANNKKQK